MAKLGVNIDHVATVRQARKGLEPDPVHAAVLAELAGADGINKEDVKAAGISNRNNISTLSILRLNGVRGSRRFLR